MSYITSMIAINYLAMESTKKLTPVMQECYNKIKDCKVLVRWSGGYWTRPGCPVKTLYDGEVKLPEWHFNWGTIKSLMARELIVSTQKRYDSYSGKYIDVEVRLVENKVPS